MRSSLLFSSLSAFQWAQNIPLSIKHSIELHNIPFFLATFSIENFCAQRNVIFFCSHVIIYFKRRNSCCTWPHTHALGEVLLGAIDLLGKIQAQETLRMREGKRRENECQISFLKKKERNVRDN